MNLYFCTDDLWGIERYVVAESRRKAKRMYCACENVCDFTMIHTYIMCRDFKFPAGVYDENCETLRVAVVQYCDETEDEKWIG